MPVTELNCTTADCDSARFLGAQRSVTNVLGQSDFLLSDGTSANAHLPSMCRALSRPSQNQTLLFPGSISLHGFRLTYLSRKLLRYQSLSVHRAKKSIPRQDLRFYHQQLKLVGINHCRIIPLSLADRIVFQMDQRTPTHQKVCQYDGEYRQKVHLNRRFRLYAGRHHQHAIEHQSQPLHDSSGFKRDAFEKIN